MRPNLNPRLRNREPEPGLLNLPVPLPSVAVVSHLISPVVAGSNQQNQPSSAPKPNPAPAPSPAPPPPPPRPAPAPAPAPSPAPAPAPAPAPGPGSGNKNGGSQNGGGNSHPGGSNGNSGNSNGNHGGERGNGASQGSNLGNQHGNGSGGSSGSQQNSNITPTSPGGPSSVVAAGAPADVRVSVIGSSTFLVTPTGLVPKPENEAIANAATDPSGSGSVSNDPSRQSSPSGSSSSATPLGDPAKSAGAGTPPTTFGGSSMIGGVNGGNDGSNGSTSGSGESGAASQSHLSGGAKGGIAAAILIVVLGIALFILRKRYKRRKDERRVEWINGYVSGDAGSNRGAPDMLQRSNSKRSSWGTPFEYRISDAFRRSVVSSNSDDQDYNYIVSPPSPYYDYDRSASGAPVLPMPVHSPTQARAHSPEDPFADGLAQPLRRMSSLPLRISILSSASGHEDPFDDHNTPPAPADNPVAPDSPASSATFGPGTRNIAFPLPPPTPGSKRDTVNTLLTPGIMISFPDSPISPTFAASGTSSYPRRAMVQQAYIPPSTRLDEVRVNQGDSVSVVSVYEDGWAFVQREADNERGLVPLTHLAM